ncbi:scopoletin glucosyltransferase [Beta vulgaris subsp. vulgaris]|uniref:scopoletin glucosyltransferase n=1 Tax=Beta vulgaris subsp. vulgaris TaxID=3555 RepID=UPI002037550E|nr:scopoletin glucosyltransferase [Beta vulgaris subsp. vulgaris]
MSLKPKDKLHIVFFPFMAHGHMIPMLDTATLFAARGIKATIITTPRNFPIFARANETGHPSIEIEVFRFPSLENGLPEGCENLGQAMKSIEMAEKFIKSAAMLRQQLEQYLEKSRPHFLVADMFFPWATECAAKFNIPRLIFHGISFFAHCTKDMIMVYQPYKHVSSDEDPFVIPYFPNEITLTRSQIPEDLMKHEQSELKKRHEKIQESELQCYGVIVNSFYELEPDYVDFFKKKLGRRAWHIGPVSSCNKSLKDKAQRGGGEASMNEHECLKWLNLRKPNSVIYICFGSLANFIVPQLQEIAKALEALEYDFIWVLRDDRIAKNEEWLPLGFKKRTQGKGLLIGGWVPQVLILEHEATGAFVTHCGWNSTLEAISAGIPMVTWPLFAEQFYNEKLVNHILKIGTPVGAKKWKAVHSIEDVVEHNDIEKAIKNIMEGDETQAMRNRAKNLKEMARKAMEEDGSSYRDLCSLINELRDHYTP